MESKIISYGSAVSDYSNRYKSFVESKSVLAEPVGFESEPPEYLFGFQRDITRWAIKRGRAAIFADCGLGKTPMQLAWADAVSNYTKGSVLIFAPLAVAEQTVKEGRKFGVDVAHVRDGSEISTSGIYITNYDRIHKFMDADISGIILDESSILKSYDGVTRTKLIEYGARCNFRLACTATPAPNDIIEILNHSEFLGIMREKEVRALYFTQDGNSTTKYRIKRHAVDDFYKWMATWCVALRKPSDIGHDDDGFVLPALTVSIHEIGAEYVPEGELFAVNTISLQDERKIKRLSLDDRVKKCASMVDNEDQWIIWCELNDEAAT